MRTSESECIEALREAAEILGESPTRAQYEDLGLTPAQGTIKRVMGSWNEAKEAAGLSTTDYREAGVGTVQPKPEDVELADDEEWEELSAHQRWYRANREQSRERKERRRRKLVRWVYEYKRDNCECARCGEGDPACLEFHHREESEKEFSVSRRANRGHSVENIRAEIDRCEVLCANCHRKEHYEVPPDPDDGKR
ncbi:HNH endonuclease [Halobacteriales archaeon QS_8_69_26]|nr:MAG: HNH endonuclease [Halobacteriales archaeon QS_8_69_26]